MSVKRFLAAAVVVSPTVHVPPSCIVALRRELLPRRGGEAMAFDAAIVQALDPTGIRAI